MLRRHISRELVAHLDGELTGRAAQRVEAHLARCGRCAAEREEVRFAMTILEQLPAAQAPDAIWTSIAAALARGPRREPERRAFWRLGFAALAMVTVAGLAYWISTRSADAPWEVTQIQGMPAVDSKPVSGAGRIGAGEWIETDSRSIASVRVGEIGSVEVAPNTRVQVVRARPSEHRLALGRGEIRAKISAPPRLFFVDTRAGTAVDLGCEYSLQSDEDGLGLLQVTRGWVAFQWKDVESLVPAGASCRLRAERGPGVPAFDDAPESFKKALESLTESGAPAPLDIVLTEARARDTLTLWHLLSRVRMMDRERIYDRMAALAPVPAGVSRASVLKLDRDTLTRWKDELAWTW